MTLQVELRVILALGMIDSQGALYDFDDWADINSTDYYANPSAGRAIGYLLYRDATEVAEPTTMALFTLLLVGLGFRRVLR